MTGSVYLIWRWLALTWLLREKGMVEWKVTVIIVKKAWAEKFVLY